MEPCKLVICPLNLSEGHYYGNGGLTSAVPLLLKPTFVELNDFKVAPHLTDALVLLRLGMFEPLHHPCSPTLWGSHVKSGGSGSRQYKAHRFHRQVLDHTERWQNELVYASKTKPTFHPPAPGRSWITRQKWTDCCAACVTQPKCHSKLQYYKYGKYLAYPPFQIKYLSYPPLISKYLPYPPTFQNISDAPLHFIEFPNSLNVMRYLRMFSF
jgi:hypothetical protein